MTEPQYQLKPPFQFGEPWKIDVCSEQFFPEAVILDTDNKGVFAIDSGGFIRSKDDIERIVTCVNFCRGIPTRQLWLRLVLIPEILDKVMGMTPHPDAPDAPDAPITPDTPNDPES